MVQLSHLYMTTGKTIALTIWTFVSKVILLLFNTLSMFVIDFFPKEQVPFNFMVAVTICSDFGAQENEVCYCFQFFPIYLPWSDGTGCQNLSCGHILTHIGKSSHPSVGPQRDRQQSPKYLECMITLHWQNSHFLLFCAFNSSNLGVFKNDYNLALRWLLFYLRKDHWLLDFSNEF